MISLRSRPEDVTLPAAADPAAGVPDGSGDRFRGISRLRTPSDDFYRVDTSLSLPTVSLDGWTLTIDGDVEQELTFSFDDLLAMPLIERDITLTCVSNEVGGPYVGGARWLGVRLTDLLDRAGVGDRADQILSTDVDGFTISTPLAVATDGRDAMIAIGMNGEALPREHGFPARLVIPGLYGFVSATKWLTRLTLTTYAEEQAYWTERNWATDAPIKIASRIDTPKPLSTIKSGRTVIGGVAWAQHRRHRQGRGPGRRRPVAGGHARPGRRRRLLAAVVPALGRRRPAQHQLAVRATDRRRRDPDRCAGRPRSPTGRAASRRSSSPSDRRRLAIWGAPNPVSARAESLCPSRRRPTTKGIHMQLHTLRRTGGRAALASPCRSAWPPAVATTRQPRTQTTPTAASPSESMTPSETSTDAGAQTFGAGCASVPTDGAGSFNGMATAPVASAASANPLLKTLVTAVTEAGLVDTLNSAQRR